MKYFNILTKKIKNVIFMLILHCYVDSYLSNFVSES